MRGCSICFCLIQHPKKTLTPGLMGLSASALLCRQPQAGRGPLAACPGSWGTGVENAASVQKPTGLWACSDLENKPNQTKDPPQIQTRDAVKQDPQGSTCRALPHAGHHWSSRTGTTGVLPVTGGKAPHPPVTY